MIERLLQNITLRNQLMEIAVEVAPVIQSKKVNDQGQKCRYISTKTINFTSQSIGEYIQYDVSVEYLSDIGDFTYPLIVKQFFSHQSFQDEINQCMRLSQRMVHRTDISILPILYKNESDLFVCYEGGTGTIISELEMDQELIDFLMGIICAAFQGPQVQSNDLKNIVQMTEYLLNQTEIIARRKRKITEWLRLHYYLLSKTKSGYFPLGLLDHKSIWVSLKGDVSNITRTDLINTKPYHIHILYVPPQITINDRMIDIAMYFGEEVFQEYIDFGSIDQSRKRIVDFLKGYEYEYDQDSYLPIEMLYPEGLTLDLNVLLVSWLFANQLINDSNSKKEKKYLQMKLYRFADLLLTTLPLKFYDDPEDISQLKIDWSLSH